MFWYASFFLLASRPFTGRWFDKYGANIVIYPSILLFACGLLLISQAHVGIMLLMAGALYGVGFGTFQSSTQAVVIKKVPNHRMGLATSTYFTFYDFGVGVGPFLLGFAIPYVGFRGVYFAMAILAFGCMLIYYFVHGKSVSKRKMDKEQQA